LLLGRAELLRTADQGEELEVCCEFCRARYSLSPREIRDLANESRTD
jgi:redox-regulated HSP33 family molecular chaperone